MLKLSLLYSAIGKSMLAKYGVYLANLISLMLLARLFSPATFGTVATIAVFLAFFQLISEAGLTPAVINLERLSIEDRNGIFGFTIALGLVCSLAFLALTPIFVAFYALSRVAEVVPYIAFAVGVQALATLPAALLLREQKFFRVSSAALLAEIGSTISTILLLQYTDGLHALASKGAVSAAINFAVLFFFSAKTDFGRPSVGWKLSALKPLTSISLHQIGFNFINYFSRNLDNILIGKYFGATTLGIYDKAYQLMKYPLLLLTYAMNPAIQPSLRKFANDVGAIEELHRKFTLRLAILGAAAGVSMYFLSPLIVRILLGSKWDDVIPMIQVLSIAIPAQVVLSTSGGFFQALNRVDLLFKSGLFLACIIVAIVIAGVATNSLSFILWGVTAAFYANFVQCYGMMYKNIFRAEFRRLLPTSMVSFSAGTIIAALNILI